MDTAAAADNSSTSSPASTNSGEDDCSFKRSQETASKRFDRTSNGKIYTKNLNEIFSMLIINLKLSMDSSSHAEKNVFKIFRNKSFPYSFTIEDAVAHMKDLELKVNLLTTCTTFSYSVKPDLAISLLRKFMRAKWLHCPADRTRSEPKTGVVLQPTPKGCAILQNFCLKVGLKKSNFPAILNTNFNSMGLISFERDPRTDHIIQSEYLIHLLFVRFLSPEPNIWSSTNDPDPIPQCNVNTDEFDFLQGFDTEIENPFSEWDHSNSIDTPKTANSPKIQESPFHHRFFTNPESDAHVQYYVSNKGIRFSKSREFGNPPIKISHFFSGKAAVQWFMDCTDCLYPLEAAEIVNLLIKHGLVEPITLPPSCSPKVGFKAASDCFYTLTSKGYSIVEWDQVEGNSVKLQNESTAISPNFMAIPEKLSLQDVLEDPGSRFLFRQHLKLEHCEENLDAYVEIFEFFKAMAVLKKIIKLNNHQKRKEFDLSQSSSLETAKYNELKNTRNQAILELANDCLSKSYSIYSSFLSNGSPYAINISDDWREEAQSILVHPNSPLVESFPGTPLTPVTNAIDGFDNDGIDKVPIEKTNGNNNSKNLSIDVVEEGVATDRKVFLPLTPSTQSMSTALNVLGRIDHVLKKINQHIFFLLSQDSFPKFINSEVFQKNTNQIKLSRSQSE